MTKNMLSSTPDEYHEMGLDHKHDSSSQALTKTLSDSVLEATSRLVPAPEQHQKWMPPALRSAICTHLDRILEDFSYNVKTNGVASWSDLHEIVSSTYWDDTLVIALSLEDRLSAVETHCDDDLP
ncbi:hypothetical protein SCOR_27400 [Sulfidibacter corallicola]|uniref:Uncharacterized protein n=1 Tax=Sulfidibacter corallicola TaxID=2818388 RepID=A0A8A4TMD8_SULCO|nr:hypothetical protein [Sulfidibacter corallicola]QTD50720.1 hypothetical protein J3U87_34470 [Sulfidibacter corallicola]